MMRINHIHGHLFFTRNVMNYISVEAMLGAFQFRLQEKIYPGVRAYIINYACMRTIVHYYDYWKFS